MTDQPELVWALLASLLIGNALLLVLNLPLAPVWAKLLRIPRPQLYAGILFFATLGAYASNLQAFDLFLLLVLGLLGLMMRRFALPVLPLILGVILGPLMEFRLREAMAISGGEVSGALERAARRGDLRDRGARRGRAAGAPPDPARAGRGRRGRGPGPTPTDEEEKVR